ncbi:beta-lactamase family protein [Pseudomaricurvus alkylphenolicus]|nr:beta-lactamase family protein [Pseudomaricurvus alkylphenolicus]
MYKVSESVEGYPIAGSILPGFEPVLSAFKENFRKRGEIGAACSAFRGNKLLFDLQGGYKDKNKARRWEYDTMACVHSSTKAITAIAMAMAMSRGYFQLDDRVAAHWPEFAVNGKQDITIRQILNHSAGLPIVNEPLTLDLLADYDTLSEILACQNTQWEPGTRHGYHGWTYGMYCNEIMRRTDPKSRSIGCFVREEINQRLNEEFYIGLPDSISDDRVANEIVNWRTLVEAVSDSPRTAVLGFIPKRFQKQSLQVRMLHNPPEVGDLSAFHSRALRKIELPGGNGIGTARAMAHIMGVCASGGEVLGLAPEILAELEKTHPKTGVDERDAVLEGKTTLFQGGCMKPNSTQQHLINRPRSYFHFGGGGNLAHADPDTGIGFGYCNNRMGVTVGDVRSDRLLEVTLKCAN